MEQFSEFERRIKIALERIASKLENALRAGGRGLKRGWRRTRTMHTLKLKDYPGNRHLALVRKVDLEDGSAYP